MSFAFAKQTIRMLLSQYGTSSKIKLTKYYVGETDFKNAEPNNGVETLDIFGIAMPKGLNVAFLQKSTFAIDKKSRVFLFGVDVCTQDWVKEGNYVTYLEERYNIKYSDYLEGIYFYVVASSAGDEEYDRTL
jgi:hypothetical protein